ncbi:hypothetical protein BC936DRAFT_144194 [Jimgerdemannia flammicorona]|uniref:Uncharacterized protein n=1 Tax=Jimgerdemannia flammicorona TaxID=994334 RepID=A0A433DM44_9FUNG|nr:hypothetical protein BC936DRAFT_144194 [Jimgerdemannia flammicorona]
MSTCRAKRPDFACLVNKIPVLNSETKPLGVTPFQQSNDRLKVHLRARKAINQLLEPKGGLAESAIFTNAGDLVESYIMDLKYDELYRSWAFLTTRLVRDKTTIPLLESNLRHFMALEERVNKMAENYKSKSASFTPPLETRYKRNLPDTPQMKMILQ